MREIKFRAWLPKARKTVWSDYGSVELRLPDARKRGRMVEFDELYFSISHDSLEHPQIFTDTSEHFYGEDIDKAAEGAVLMQYTGLKDKNGKEIYEGDIVNSFSPARDYYEREVDTNFVVVYLEGYWNVIEYVGELEVIGNIYENPEVLAPQVPNKEAKEGEG